MTANDDILIAPANGHYSQAIQYNDLLFISGQLSIENGNIPATFGEEVQLVLDKIDRILTKAGYSREQVIQVRIYIVDIANWSEVDKVYSGFFGSHKPARAIVPVPELHFGCSIEAEVVCARDQTKIQIIC